MIKAFQFTFVLMISAMLLFSCKKDESIEDGNTGGTMEETTFEHEVYFVAHDDLFPQLNIGKLAWTGENTFEGRLKTATVNPWAIEYIEDSDVLVVADADGLQIYDEISSAHANFNPLFRDTTISYDNFPFEEVFFDELTQVDHNGTALYLIEWDVPGFNSMYMVNLQRFQISDSHSPLIGSNYTLEYPGNFVMVDFVLDADDAYAIVNNISTNQFSLLYYENILNNNALHQPETTLGISLSAINVQDLAIGADGDLLVTIQHEDSSNRIVRYSRSSIVNAAPSSLLPVEDENSLWIGDEIGALSSINDLLYDPVLQNLYLAADEGIFVYDYSSGNQSGTRNLKFSFSSSFSASGLRVLNR